MGGMIASGRGRTVARAAIGALAALGMIAGQSGVTRAASLDDGSRTLGVVVADEPHAALAARDILERGGSVADAATALYFTLAVTYPVAAGLGGGGLCLHYNADTGSATSIDFLPRATRQGGTVAVPGAVRGFALVQSRFGRLAWRDVLLPAQRHAALGFPVSRALAEALKSNASIVKQSPFLTDLFTIDGELVREGDHVSQVSLAAALALIAGRGPVGFYGAPFGAQIIQAANKSGGTLTRSDLYDYRAQDAEAPAYELNTSLLIAPAIQTGAGALAAVLVPGLQPLAASSSGDEIGAAVRRAVREALGGFGVAELPQDFGSTGFLIADREGELIACGVTMTRPFGTAQQVETNGFTLAPAPDKSGAGLAGAFLMPLVLTGPKARDVIFAGVGAGGPDAVSGVSALAIASLARDPAALAPAWAAAESTPGNSVNMLACTKGLLSSMRSCTAAADTQGHGVALQGTEQRSGGGGFLGLF